MIIVILLGFSDADTLNFAQKNTKKGGQSFQHAIVGWRGYDPIDIAFRNPKELLDRINSTRELHYTIPKGTPYALVMDGWASSKLLGFCFPDTKIEINWFDTYEKLTEVLNNPNNADENDETIEWIPSDEFVKREMIVLDGKISGLTEKRKNLQTIETVQPTKRAKKVKRVQVETNTSSDDE